MRLRLLPVLAAVLAAVALAVGCGAAGLGEGDARTIAPPGDRKPAPTVSLAALDGGPRVTLASHRGRPVVMNLWASWCEPCQRETPALVAFSKEHPGLDVIGVATNDAPADSRRFARQKGIPYPIGVEHDRLRGRALRRHRPADDGHHRRRGPGGGHLLRRDLAIPARGLREAARRLTRWAGGRQRGGRRWTIIGA